MMNLAVLVQLPLGLSGAGVFGHEVIQMVLHAGLVVKFVLLLLVSFSVVSWAIIFAKLRLMKKAKEETEEFLEIFWESSDMKEIYKASEDLTYSPVARLFRAGYAEFIKLRKIEAGASKNAAPAALADTKALALSSRVIMDNLERSLRRAGVDQLNRLERALSFLATTGNTAPFIGLFGTVWGIMESFRGIGLRGSASLAVVAPGISEALIATAAGLATAIPAVVAFNYFTQQVEALRAEMEIFTSDFLSLMERRLFRGQVASK